MSLSGVMQNSTSNSNGGLANMINALDNTKHMRVGENEHPEYDWNRNDLQEQLLQIYFQSVRSDFSKRYKIMDTFRKWVSSVLTPAYHSGITNLERRKAALALALLGYKTIAQLRDITDGKGECRLAYCMLCGWYDGVKDAAFNVQASGAKSLADNLNELAIQTTVKMATLFMISQGDNTQFGSYKDFKYICQEFALIHLASTQSAGASVYINPADVIYEKYEQYSHVKVGKNYKKRRGTDTFRFTPELMNYLKYHPVISAMADAYGAQIFRDYTLLTTSAQTQSSSSQPSTISLAGKWAPRASSELFAPIRTLLFNTVVPETGLWRETAQTAESKKKLEIKIETTYRKRLSAINRHLETVQVKQCTKKWASIDFDKDMTSITLARQKKAFAKSTDSHGQAVPDREKCAENFRAFMERVAAGTSTAKGKRIAVSDFVKEALRLYGNITYRNKANTEEQATFANEKMLLDKQWEDKGTTISSLEDFIAMVDVSGSMDCDNSYPMNTAIGLGIRIAEKSRLGNRVMTFSDTPTWVNLDDKPSFTDRVAQVKQAPWGMNTNFYAALTLILEAATNAKLTPADVGKLTLVILSDMQIDAAMTGSSCSWNNERDKNMRDSMFEKIRAKFAATGKHVCGEPYPVPKVVFWNLRKTNGFPSSSTDSNAIMISGGSDAILNDLCENGIGAISNINPWNSFVAIMEKPRYSSLDNSFSDWIV
jgi:hypothetical protein